MELKTKHIKEFQALYKKHFGIDLSWKEAFDKSLHLVQILDSISKYKQKSSSSETRL